MAFGIFWGVSAGVMAVAAGGFLADGLSRSVKHKQAAMNMLSDGWASKWRMLLVSGVRPLNGLSSSLLRLQIVDDIASQAALMLEENGIKSKAASLVSLMLVGIAVTVLGSFALSGSPVFGLAVGCIDVVGVAGYIKNKSDKTAASLREDVPEVIRCMQACFKSGQSLLQTLRYTSQEVGGPLGKIFATAADRLEVGETPQSALSILKKYPNVGELAFVAVALDVQHQTGGSIVPVLESARESVEGELELMRTLRVQTAQAKLSATIVTVMPFVLMALFSLMSPDFLAPFVSSWQGFFLLLLALIMQMAGVISVRRMLKIDLA